AKRIKRSRPELADIMHSAPGEEAQVDFFQGPLTLDPETGRFYHPWVFRVVLAHSRHSYEEAVRKQDFLSFIRLHERAFRFFGGVPKAVRLEPEGRSGTGLPLRPRGKPRLSSLRRPLGLLTPALLPRKSQGEGQGGEGRGLPQAQRTQR
ncbi:MAG: DDE-type integrase/transposase/recombinase, partial [Actinomycetota bacterium]|nr:DDE-type integrase/transposase/recombinase [Actinomycetota bacterium]